MEMDISKILDEALKGLEEAKKRISEVVSWIYGHPRLFSGEFADEVRELADEINESINEIKARIKEEVGGVAL